MIVIHENEYTGEYDLINDVTGEKEDSVNELFAARSLARMYNQE